MSQEHVMEPQVISVDVLLEKYAKGDEQSIQDVRRRVARALASVEKEEDRAYWEDVFYQTLEGGFVPAGRINSAAGMDLKATLMNCFVQPVGDCIEGVDDDGYPSIYTALGESASTMRRGGGVGYDFSRIRPFGALVKGTQSRASGPLSYMKVFDKSCETVESAGARRGAQMGVLRCDHPDIFDFVVAKATKGAFNNFNLSVGVTDAFMTAVRDNTPWPLVHKVQPGKEYMEQHGSYQDKATGKWVWKVIPVAELWELIMQSTYNQAEPGILFLDQMNKENNLWYCEQIEATNPCAEQPLPKYACCDLGSSNLTRFVRNPFTPQAWFDWDAYKANVRVSIRMLDNVLDASAWPLKQQYEEAMNKRRIGLGFLGIGDAIIMLGLRYEKEDGVKFAEQVSECMRDTAYHASVDLAVEKGAFPMLDIEKHLQGAFISRLPEDLKARIRQHGIRNSHLLSIAPTGTITLAFADNASNGIEPPFSWVYNRKKRMADGSSQEFEVADHAWRLYRAMGHDMTKLPENFVTALDMSVEAHVNLMKAVQPYCDTAISKTVNIPADYPYEDFKGLYMYAWECGLKGLATYRPNNILGSVLSVKEEKKPEVVVEEKKEEIIDQPVINEVQTNPTQSVEDIVAEMYNQSFSSRKDGTLEGLTVKGRFFTSQDEQKFLLTINFLTMRRETDHGVIVVKRPVEFVLQSNFQVNSSSWDAAIRMMSVGARYGVPLDKIIENLKEITWEHGNVRYGTMMKGDKEIPKWHPSDAAVIGFIIEEELKKQGYLTEDGKVAKAYSLLTTATVKTPVVVETKVEGNTAEVAEVVQPTEAPKTGKLCGHCGAYAVIKKDGCSFCENCGDIGTCG